VFGAQKKKKQEKKCLMYWWREESGEGRLGVKGNNCTAYLPSQRRSYLNVITKTGFVQETQKNNLRKIFFKHSPMSKLFLRHTGKNRHRQM